MAETKISHPYRTVGKVIVIFQFLCFRQQTRRQKVLDRIVASMPKFNILLIPESNFDLLLQFANISTVTNDLFAIFTS
jgi:hypothetical protein